MRIEPEYNGSVESDVEPNAALSGSHSPGGLVYFVTARQPQRLWIALAAALSHWALIAAVQTGSFCAYLMPVGSDPLDALGYLTTIPFIQGQAIVVAAALALAAWVLAANRFTRWLIIPVHLLVTVFVLADLSFYKISFDHLRPSLFEVGRRMNVAVAISSVAKDTDAVLALAAAIALAGETWLVWMLVRSPHRPPKLMPWGALAALLLLAGIPAFRSGHYYHLNEHPVMAAAQDWMAGSLIAATERRTKPRSIAAAEPLPVDRDSRLSQLLAEGRTPGRRPNIVLVVLESVGARTLLGDDGLPDPLFAPNLNRLARRGVLFDSVYVPFPATTRSLVSLHTGGRSATEESLRPLEFRYQGPLLGRAMQQLGYSTALFSSERLDVENCDVFLKQCGYDRFQDFENDFANRDERNSIHSWGAREEYTIGLMSDWLNSLHGDQPFYLEYMNVATHHPYGTPPGYHPPFPGKDPESQYRNAIHYSDRAIAMLLEMLEHRGLAENTVIAVTGDHGEGFGTFHKMNFLHREFIYEENVRGFFLLLDPRWKVQAPVISQRIASNGAIMPTLLTYAGASEADVPGRNLLEESWETRPQFFYKLAIPEEWGLRDGRWKFIQEIRSGKAELYDLTGDPLEQHNVAGESAARVSDYGARCEEWYIRSGVEFAARVPEYRPPSGRRLLPEDYKTPGPKIQSVGTRGVKGFDERSTIDAQERATVWDSWVPDGKRRPARWRWVSPTGEESWSDLQVMEGWNVTYAEFPGNLPMLKGDWRVTLLEDGRPELTTRFRVK